MAFNRFTAWLSATFSRRKTLLGQVADDPILSLCVSTYNRARWLEINLKNWARLYPRPLEGVEVIVCDNASTDDTSEIVAKYKARPDFRYIRNEKNVGMLGNLRETVFAARGAYIWIVGDDDLIVPNALGRIMEAIRSNPGIPLIYLNYSFTKIDDTRRIRHFAKFFREAEPRVPPEPDQLGPLRDICARNENFFTAIYTLVFRRDHARLAYSQDTSGRPFSTMLTCIPTTHYVLNNLMQQTCVWIGEPQIVINLNVSWMRYAPLWILERIPEVYDAAQAQGVAQDVMDRWRVHTLPGFVHYFKEIFRDDPLGNSAYFSPERAVARFDRLPEFVPHREALFQCYLEAHQSGHPAAQVPAHQVFKVKASPLN